MDVACVATGGTHLSTYKNRSIEKAIDEIGGELHSQYTVGYAPSDANDIGYHEIKVDVDRKNLKVRARRRVLHGAAGRLIWIDWLPQPARCGALRSAIKEESHQNQCQSCADV